MEKNQKSGDILINGKWELIATSLYYMREIMKFLIFDMFI